MSCDYSDQDECDDGDDDRESETERIDAETERWTCVLGDRCLVADPFHMADECFDAEWAERYFAEQADPDDPMEPPPAPAAEAEDDLLLS